MDPTVAKVARALTNNTVPLGERLDLLNIPCKTESKAASHEHKSSCLYKALPRLLKLFFHQVNKDLSPKKKMPRTGFEASQEKSMLSLLVAKLALVARGFYSEGVLSPEDDFYMSLIEHVKEDQQLMLEAVSRNIANRNSQLMITLEGYEHVIKSKPGFELHI